MEKRKGAHVKPSDFGAGQTIMTKKSLQGNQYRTTVVCVDSYENSVPQGRFFNPACPRGVPFYSLMQFFMGIDGMMNRLKLPQSFTAGRSFIQPNSEAADFGQNRLCRQGRLATFSLRVIFRQNASWQGALSWLEGGREENFRSALELVFLMDSALCARLAQEPAGAGWHTTGPGDVPALVDGANGLCRKGAGPGHEGK